MLITNDDIFLKNYNNLTQKAFIVKRNTMENEDNDRFREIDINIVNELRIRKVKWIDVCKDLKMSKSKVNE